MTSNKTTHAFQRMGQNMASASISIITVSWKDYGRLKGCSVDCKDMIFPLRPRSACICFSPSLIFLLWPVLSATHVKRNNQVSGVNSENETHPKNSWKKPSGRQASLLVVKLCNSFLRVSRVSGTFRVYLPL